MGCENFYGWAMSHKWSANGVKRVEDLSEFNEVFIKSCNEKSNEGYFLEVDIQYPENLHELQNDLPFLVEIKKVDKVKTLVANLQDKKGCYKYKKSKTSIKSRISFEKKKFEVIKFKVSKKFG